MIVWGVASLVLVVKRGATDRIARSINHHPLVAKHHTTCNLWLLTGPDVNFVLHLHKLLRVLCRCICRLSFH